MGPASNASPQIQPQPYPKQRLATVGEIIKNLLPAMALILVYLEIGTVIDSLLKGKPSFLSLAVLVLYAVAAGSFAFSASYSAGERLRAD